MPNIPLYTPGEAPMLGMVSSQDPAGLPQGVWRLIDNLQISRNSAQGRLGCLALQSTAITGGSFRGYWSGRLNGTEYVVAAYRVGSETIVYKYDTTTWARTELTNSAPNTRFATDGDVCFAPFRELGIGGSAVGKDMLYMSNGTADVPRCSATLLVNSVGLLYNFDLGPIAVGTYRPIPAGYVKIKDPANTTVTVSDADMVAADTAADPINEVSIAFGGATSADVGDWANIAWGANSCVNIFGSTETTENDLDLSRSQMLGIILYDTSADPIHNYCNVEVTQSAAQVEIYTAAGVDRVDPAIVSLGGGYYLAGFHLQASVAATLTEVTGVRFEVSRTFAATRTIKVAGVLAMGRVGTVLSYEITFATNSFRNESASIVLSAQQPAAVSEYGVSRDIAYKLPYSKDFWYQYRIDWGGILPPSDDASATAPDGVYLYRKEPGDDRAKFVVDMGTSNTPINDNNPDSDRVKFRPSPSPGGRGPLSGRAAAYSNDRLFIGGINAASSQMWGSDELFPLRFQALPSDEDQDGVPDPGAGFSKSFPGEDVYHIAQIPGTLSGIAPIAVFTSDAVYRHEGIDCASLSRPTLISQHGTIYPRTVKTHRGTMEYLDIDLVVRRLSGGINNEELSTNLVDDQFEGGDVTKACGFVWKEQYGLAHRASGSVLNQRVMVFDFLEGKWCRHSYTTSAQNWGAFTVIGSGSTRKMIGFTEEGRVYHILKSGQTTDDGTDISMTLTTGEIHDDMWEQRSWGSVGVVADSIAGVTWTITRLDENDNSLSGSGVGTINIGQATTRAYEWEKSSGTGLVRSGIKTAALRLTITGKVQPGKFLKAMVLGDITSTLVPGGKRSG